MHVLKNTWFCS